MSYLKPLSFTLLILLFSSCTLPKHLTSNVPPENIRNISLYPTHSYISLINEGNILTQNDSLSQLSAKIIDNSLKENSQKLRINNVLNLPDTSLQNQINREIEQVVQKLNLNYSLDSTTSIPPTLDSLMDIRGIRFSAALMGAGFTRSKKNYTEQIVKGVFVGILTMGMFVTTPYKSKSNLYALIFDAEQNNIAFFNKDFEIDEDPLAEEFVSKQVVNIFEGYLWQEEAQNPHHW